MARFLFGCLTAIQFAERRAMCQATWIPHVRASGHDFVFLMGAPELKAAERFGDLLLQPCAASYKELPQRTRHFCQWALERNDWEYLIKCDDDTFFCMNRFQEYADAGNLKGRDYVGCEWRRGTGYANGMFYVLSREAAKIVAKKLRESTGAEDLLVGKHLRAQGVKFHIETRFQMFGNMSLRPMQGNDMIAVNTQPEIGLEPQYTSAKELYV